MKKLYRFNQDKAGFGKKLKSLMSENGYTIESLAAELYISENTVKKWRSGERVPDLDTIKKLADMLNTTMHKLYMPNSIYEHSFSDEMSLFLDRRITFASLSLKGIAEVEMYSEYLFQKLLFSFLLASERKHLEVLMECYDITEWGKEKLNLDNRYSFEDFYFKVRDYIQKEYGKSLPYIITESLSKKIYKAFELMFIIKEGV